MSKLNLYETSWTDIVFENRNKEYGAYLLRQENARTSLSALFFGVLLLASAISAPMVYNYLNPAHQIPTLVPDLPPVVVTNFDPYIPPPAKPEEAAMPEPKTATTDAINTDSQLINPTVVAATEATKIDLVPNAQISSSNSNTTETMGTGTGTSTSTGASTGTSSPGITENAIVSTTILDKLPEFPGGINKFYSYVGSNFEKPEIDSETMIRVNVSFVIEKDGSMTDIRVLKDPGYGLGREAIRVLKSLKTKWAPGILDGKAVRTAYNLPITIQAN